LRYQLSNGIALFYRCTGAHILVLRTSGSQRMARDVVNELSVNMLIGPENRQPWALGRAV
jgi:hypothetical protein